ncbi:hypothetical protein LVD13_04050 [Flavobacteriaceae bacterium D16]|nr:hypothetical protein [Flavobacteriaceae bacterium D16]
MQTLSRYFVAFLLLLVSSFLEEQETVKAPQHASLQKLDPVIKQATDTSQLEFFYRCS